MDTIASLPKFATLSRLSCGQSSSFRLLLSRSLQFRLQSLLLPFMPPVSTPSADGIVAGVDVLSVGDDLRTTVFGYIAHLVPQLFHFLVFFLPLSLSTALCPFCFTKTPLALIVEAVQLLLECRQVDHSLHGSATDSQGVGNLFSIAGDSGEHERGSLYLLGFFCTSGSSQRHHSFANTITLLLLLWSAGIGLL